MRTLLSITLLLFLSSCTTGPRTEDEHEVLAVADAFFDVISTKDVEVGARIVLPEAAFASVRVDDGRQVVRHFTGASWLERLPTMTESMYEAFDGPPTVLVDGDVAVVWGRYVFDLDGERSHTGTDAFNLVRTDDGWRISGGAYSVVVADEPAP